jgi:penicillin-binding protein 1A
MYNEIGGKTGTTQNNSDGWFMGVTPDLVSGTWVGGEDRSIHFEATTIGGGHNMALPIFALYMQKVYNDSTIVSVTQDDEFEKPLNFAVEIDCDKYQENNTEEMDYDDEFF